MKKLTTNSEYCFLRNAWLIAKPYWFSKDRYKAISILVTIVTFSLLEVYMSVRLNKWNSHFYNALQNYNKSAFLAALEEYGYIIFLFAIFTILANYFSSVLEIRWRRWLTYFYLDEWLQSNTYYNARFTVEQVDNPDQRISEDIREFVRQAIFLFNGVLKSVTTLTSFTIILWGFSGNFKFTFLNLKFYIPGLILWLAIMYSLLGTYLAFKIGRPLIKLAYEQQAYEADFRYSLVMIREHAESIRSYNGGIAERSVVVNNFKQIFNNFLFSAKRDAKLSLFNFVNRQISTVVPIILVSGKYFNREITLGNLMQINSAFSQVQFSIAYFAFIYPTVANWRSVIMRITEFENTIHEVRKLPVVPIKIATQKYLELVNFGVKLPDGRQLISNLSLTLTSGDRLLITGRSGIGKSTVLKAINGLWPYSIGKIAKLPGLHTLFINQRPYLPPLVLKEAICYPKIHNLADDVSVKEAMRNYGLGYLVDELYHIKDWSRVLSLGEQQKIAFCRIALNKPDIVYFDETSSALDELAEQQLYARIFKELPSSLFISVGHRSTLKRLHSKILNLDDML